MDLEDTMIDALSHLANAKRLIQDQQFERASRSCDEVLRDDPSNAEAWHLRGICSAQLGRLEDAIDYFSNATERGGAAIYPYNLALAYRALGDREKAIAAYRTAIDRRPDFREAINNLANTLIDDKKPVEAVDLFRQLATQFPDSSDAHFNLANTLIELGMVQEALPHYRNAIDLDPTRSAARENLGRALTEAGKNEQAEAVWNSWLEIAPDNEYAQHMLAASTGDKVPDRCTEDYVRQEFNADFAKSFDRQLSALDYRSPDLISTALRALDRPTEGLEVLDAGCGTGLCGAILRPHAKQLVGVDLSAAMLFEAQKRGLYDETLDADIVAFMEANGRRFDLIVSSDTLCYFGDLGVVVAAASRSLKTRGIFVFTVELDDQESELGHRLQANGRYCHAPDYVQAKLEDAGFLVRNVDTVVLRNEGGRPVEGLVVTAIDQRDPNPDVKPRGISTSS